MHHLANETYRSLELLCRKQAAISTTPLVRKELERMAQEYKRLADWQERQWPEIDPPSEAPSGDGGRVKPE